MPKLTDLQRRPLSPSAQTVLVDLLVHGPRSRADLGRRLSMSSANLTKSARPLIEDGYIHSLDAELVAATGRPAQPLEVIADRARFIGIKLTADRLFATVTDLVATVLHESERPLISRVPADVVEEIGTVVDELDAQYGITGVGISLAGTTGAADSHVRDSEFLGWQDVALGDLVEARTGYPTTIENDVRALTAAEHWFGAGAGVANFVVLTLGAGLGCSVVVDDRVLAGGRGAAGLVEHLRISDEGPSCEIGHVGCARAYLATRNIITAIETGIGTTGLSYDDCVRLAVDGDAVAARVFDEASETLGILAASVSNLLSPELLIVTGETSGLIAIGHDRAFPALEEALHPSAVAPEVLIRPLAFSAWARGAAVIAIQRHIDILAGASSVGRRLR